VYVLDSSTAWIEIVGLAVVGCEVVSSVDGLGAGLDEGASDSTTSSIGNFGLD
jgi:hypothetical protein